MKIYYLLFASLFIGFLTLSMPYKIRIDSAGVSITEKKPIQKKKTTSSSKKKVQTVGNGLQDSKKQTTNVLAPSLTATKSVSVQGGGNAVAGSQLNYQIVLNNGGTDATAVVLTDLLVNDLTLVAGSLKATPISANDAYSSIGNVGLSVNATNGLLANDISPDNTTLTVTAGTFTGSQSGTFVIAANGSFTYINNPGFTGSETYTYTLNSSNGTTSTGTITVTVSNTIWFINSSYSGGGNNGTLAKPFTSVNAFQAINDGANTNKGENGDVIFVHSGTYNSSAVTLRNSQKLIGQDATSSIATILGITVPSNSSTLPTTSGSTVTIANTTSTPVTLGSGNEVQGCTINSTGTTMSGASVGALKVRTTVLSASSGQALQISAGGALDVQFKSISAAGANKGISVNSSTGSFEVTGTGTTAGSGGTINNITTRGAEFSSVSNITLKNMNFTNANTTAGASSATDYATANGAITLNNVSGVTLTKIAISGTTRQRGITGKTVTNFTLNGGSTITDCGDDVNEGCLYLQELTGTCTINNATLSKGSENIARVFNTTGTLTLNIGTDATTTTFENTQAQNANMATPGAISAIRSYCFIYSGAGTATATLNTRNTSFLKAGTHGFKVISDGSGTVNANIKSCTFDNENAVLAPNDQGGSIEMTAFNTAFLNYNILNNTCRGRDIAIINIVAQVDANAQGRVNNNTVTHYRSGSAGDGIRFSAEQNSIITTEVSGNNVSGMAAGVGILATSILGTGKVNATITNNTVTITDAAASHNIQIQAGNSSSTFSNTACANVANNTTSRPDLVNGFNFRVRAVTSSGSTHRVYLQGNGTPSGSESVWANNTNTPTGAVVAQGGTYGTHVFSSSNASPVSLATCPTVSIPTYSLANEFSPEDIIEKPLEISSVNMDNNENVTEGNSSLIGNFEENSAKSNPEEYKLSDKNNASARLMAGETVTVNGSGSGFDMPAGKSTTITFSATVVAEPSTCTISNQASVSGTNFTTFNSNTVNTTLTLPVPTAITEARAICNGQSVSLLATCSGSSVAQWYDAAAPTVLLGTGSPFAQSPTSNKTYRVSCKLGSCETSKINTGLITVNARPVPNPNSNSPLCEGSTLNFTSTAGLNSYAWKGPNGFTSSQQSPVRNNISSADEGTYKLIVTNANGCIDSATVDVTVIPKPSNAIVKDTTVCGGQSITLSATCGVNTTAKWYNAAIGGTLLGSGSTYTTTAITNVTSQLINEYYVSCETTGSLVCISPTRTKLTHTINPISTLSLSSNTPLCAGQSLNISSTSSASVTYAWTGPSGYTSSMADVVINNVSTTAAGKYYLEITNAQGCKTKDSVTIEVNTKPEVPTVSNLTLCQNAPVQPLSAVSLPNHNLRWWGTAATGGVSSNTAPTPSSATVGITDFYVSQVNPTTTCESDRVALSVTIEKAISYNRMPFMLNSVTACENGTFILNLNNSLAGTGLSFKWQVFENANFVDLVNGTNYAGVNNDSLTLQNVPLAFQNQIYRCLITNICGSVVADSFRLKVTELPRFTAHPQSQIFCVGNEINLSVSATGSLLSYQWQVNTGSGFTNIIENEFYKNVNSTTLKIVGIQPGFNNNQYRCVISNNCQSENSNAATLNIDPNIMVLGQPISRVVCQGQSTTFSVSAVHMNAGTITYQWQVSTNNGFSFTNLANNAQFSGVNGPTLSLSNVTFVQNNTRFRCVMNNSCQTNTVVLTVTQVATITTQPVSQSICEGNFASFTVNATGMGLSYRWQVNTPTGFVNLIDGGIYQGSTSATLQIIGATTAANGLEFRCVVTGSSPCDVSNVVSATVTFNIATAALAQTVVVALNANTLPPVVYQAVSYVLGLNKISPPANVKYQAGNAIILNPGFEVSEGAVFEAKIQNACVTVASLLQELVIKPKK